MAKYRIYQNKNDKSAGFNKWYAKKASQGMVGVNEVVDHLVGHNSGFSKGQIVGVITEMVDHIRELAYEGKSVKIDNLGIFSVSMKSKGVTDPKKFNAQTDITSKWQVRPTGDVLIKNISLTRAAGTALTWEEDSNYTSPRNSATAAGTGNG